MSMKTRLPARRGVRSALLLLGLVTLAGSAQAQWAWRDPSGNTTFSDTPPPPEVRPLEILHQPAVQTTSNADSGTRADASGSSTGSYSGAPQASPNGTAPASPQPGADAPKPAAAPKTIAEQEADFRKRNTEREKAEQKQAEEDARSAQRASACGQAKGYQQMIESGTRLMRPDADGNRTFLDDDQRAAELLKNQEIIDKNC